MPTFHSGVFCKPRVKCLCCYLQSTQVPVCSGRALDEKLPCWCAQRSQFQRYCYWGHAEMLLAKWPSSGADRGALLDISKTARGRLGGSREKKPTGVCLSCEHSLPCAGFEHGILGKPISAASCGPSPDLLLGTAQRTLRC